MASNSVVDVAYSTLGAGLGAWVSLAKSIREATRGGNTFPVGTAGQYIDQSKATSYYLVRGNSLDSTVKSLQTSIDGTLTSAGAIVDAINPAINTAFTSIEVLINNSIDTTTSAIDFSALTTLGVIPNMNNLANAMINTQSQVGVLVGNGNSISTTKGSLVTNVNNLATTITNVNTIITAWASFQAITNGSDQFKLVAPIPTGNIVSLATSAQTQITQAPDGASTMSGLSNMPNLTAFAVQIQGIVTTLNVNVKQQITSAGDSFKGSVGPSLKSAQSSISTSIASMQSNLDTTISGGINTVDQNFNQITSYESYRADGMIALSSLILFILVVFSFGFALKRAHAVKGCNLCITPFYLLIQLFAIIMFILALVLGDVCYLIFETSPPAIGSALTADMKQYVNEFSTARTQCAQNASLITIAVNMGLINSSQVNITSQASTQINALNFTSLSSGWNLNNVLSLSNSPTSQLSTLTNLDLSSLNLTALNTLANTTLPNMKSNLITLNNSFPTGSNVNQSIFTYHSGGSPAASDVTLSISQFNSQVTNAQTLIGQLANAGGIIDQLIASTNTMGSQITTLKNNVDTLQLTNVVTHVKSNILTSLNTIQTTLYNSLECYDLAKNIDGVQNAICGQLLGGLDALWLSYALLGVVAAISIPALIYASNRLFAKYFRVDPEEPASDGKKKGKKKQAASVKKQKTHPMEEDEDSPMVY
ncbi:hypothetical protein HDV06_006184 [Boothiomyces sp. JEL0866]|nr:hypothetical protein HDV06_006184 [Boothiomyces sp. JEL0866]